MQIEVHKTVAASPPAVFKIVADIMNWPQIIGSVTAIELLTCGRVRVGTRVRLTRIMHGHQMTEELEVETFERPRRLRLLGEGSAMHYERDQCPRGPEDRLFPRTSLPINEFQRRKAPAGESRWLKHPQRPARS